jgi:eukaryotic-like serine/threonine-protein kinase
MSLVDLFPSDPAPRGDTATFSPGDVFAGRYRMITRLGRGSLGDVWHADDLVLETPVALKVIHAANPDARAHVLNEVRLARQITHPAVCRVFDVGDTKDEVFFSMELVRGEDLGTLLRRAGRLPSEKVIDIGRQLSEGVAAAHAHGVLHRDLKPANVLVDDDGLVRITDFGVATTSADMQRRATADTGRYVAPEQRVPSAPSSERTDVYAIGLILYELLAGRHPFDGRQPGEPARPSSLVPNVNPQLERIILQALSANPADRPVSAEAMAATLAAIDVREGTGRAAASASGSRRPIGLRWWIAGVGLAVAATLVVVAPMFVSRGGGTLTERDTIVLSDFENTTGELVFDGALKVALAVSLEQSPFLKVFSDDSARETLRLMQRPPDTRITRSVAREIARRERVKALLAGSIAAMGRHYVLTVEAVNAETGDVMAREQTEAESKEQVLSSLGGVASRLREKLGESLASIQRFDVALPKATTSSLDALHAYALALEEGRAIPRLEAIPHLQRAIELDPDFAIALAQLSSVYANTGQSALAPAYSRRAFDLRDRVSERERYFISWRYYRDAIQAWDQALELAKSWTATYPREAFAFNSLGAAQLRFGQYEQSAAAFREAIRLDPRFTPPYGNLAASLLALNRLDEATAVLQDIFDRGLTFAGARRISYLVAFVRGDEATMKRQFDASIGVRQTNAAFGWQAHTLGFSGRVAAAHEQFRRGIQMAQQGGFKEVAAQLTMEDAETHAIVGQCDEVRSEVPAGLQLSRDNLTLERASRALALCGADTAALTGELTKRFPEAILTTHLAVPIAQAAHAVQQRDGPRVLSRLEPVKPYDRSPFAEFFPLYFRGVAHLQEKNAEAATMEFRSIIDHRGEVPASPLYPLAHLGLARAAMLAGNAGQARQAYETFLALWKDADPNLQVLREARVEYERLPQAAPSQP